MAKLVCVLVSVFANQKHEACKTLLKVSFGQQICELIIRSNNFTLQCYLIELLHVTIPPRKHTTGDPFIAGLFKNAYPASVWQSLPASKAATQAFFQYIRDSRKMLKKG